MKSNIMIRKIPVYLYLSVSLLTISQSADGIVRPGYLESRYIKNPIDPSHAEALFEEMDLARNGLDREAFELALRGFDRLARLGRLKSDSILTIADFTKSSTKRRLYVIDLRNRRLLLNTFVAHGRGSGREYAKSFSNTPNSNMSSLGFFVTEETYSGRNGYSLRLDGVERGINDKALDRAIVMHGADYATESFAAANGYLGRSQGCLAVPRGQASKVINQLKGGHCIFIYYPDRSYLRNSRLLNG